MEIILNLSNPTDARKYISQFEIPGTPSKPSYIELNTGKVIVFATMSDEEACVAAHLIHDLVMEAAAKAIKH